MLRRSRISVRPNVRPAGRGPTPGSSQEPVQEAPATEPQASNDVDKAESNEVEDPHTTAGTENTSEPPTHNDDEREQNGGASSCGTSSSTGPQRRKRYSVMPNLAKPRVTPALTRSSNRTSRSPVKTASEIQVPASILNSEEPGPSTQTDSTVPLGLRSPRRRRPSGGARQSNQPKLQPLVPTSPSNIIAPEQSSQSEHPETTAPQVTKPGSSNHQSDGLSTSQAKDAPPTMLEKVPPSLPSREASEMSERAKTLVSRSVKSGLSLAPGKSRLSRLLNDPTDLQRLAKARKLRELLRQEMNKEKKLKKAKMCMKEYSVDPSKMTMRDLIYYLPDSNPMTSFVEQKRTETEMVIPNSPLREESPERAVEPHVVPEPEAQIEGEEEDEDEGDVEAGDDQLMVPRVKVAEDGSLIIDEESLTVEVLRAKGPNPVEDRDPIFERGSTTTYSSFRKSTNTKPWSMQETDMFFLAISMVGTDFSMIGQLFPHRARTEIKNKFKKEERENGWRIDKAFRERRKLDFDFFTQLLEKIMAMMEKKKKKKSSSTELKVKKKRKSKPKEKKAARKLSDVEEEAEEDEEGAELEGEKENEGVSNEEQTAAVTPKKKRKRKNEDGNASSPNKPKNAKRKKGKPISDQDEASVPEDTEADLPEDLSTLERSEKTDEPEPVAKGPVIKPAQLSRGRAPRPIPNLGRRWGQKGQAPCAKPKVGSSTAREESTEKEVLEDQVHLPSSKGEDQNKDMKQSDDDDEEEDEEAESIVAPVKPTRYGRIPKPTQHLNYPAKEDDTAPACDAASGSASPSSSPSSSKPKPTGRRAKLRPGPALPQKKSQSGSKKTKLVTLRASHSEESDDEEDKEQREEEDFHTSTEESQAPVFVPLSLRSPQPMASDVEETMEELDISVNVPDVLGISHNALCPDTSCEQAQGEGGSVPCDHQLDLLVDVIDFLSPEQMEVSEESYNEAARTLLTIGNQALLSQGTEEYYTETLGLIAEEPLNQCQQSDVMPQRTDQSQSSTVPPENVTPDPGVSVASQRSIEESLTSADDIASEQRSEEAPMQVASTSAEKAESEPPSQTGRSRFPKLKPKPNLGRATRTASQSKPQLAEEMVTQPLPVENTSAIPSSSAPQPIEDIATLLPLTTLLRSTISHSKSPQSTQVTELPNLTDLCSTPFLESTVSFSEAPETMRPSEENITSHSGGTEVSGSTEASDPITASDSVPAYETSDRPTSNVQPTELASTNQGNGHEVVSTPHEESGSDSTEQTASHTRRSRFPKPKPNLGRADRTIHPKPQLAEETGPQLQRVENISTITTSSRLQPTEATSSQSQTIEHTSLSSSHSEPQPLNSFNISSIVPPIKETNDTISEPPPTEDMLTQSVPQPTHTSAPSGHSSKKNEGEAGPTLQVMSGSEPTIQEKGSGVGSGSKSESGSDSAEQTASLTRRSRFPKPKPNLGRATRTAHPKPQLAEEKTAMTLKPIPSEEVTAHPETQPSTDIISILEASPCSGTLPEAQPREDVQQAGPKTSSPVSVQPMSPHQTEGHEHLPSVETEKHGLENEVQKLVSAVESQSEQLSDLNKAQGTRRARLPKLKPNLGRGGRTSVSLSGWSTTQPEPGPSEKKPTLGDLATQILDASKAPRRKAKRPLGGAKTHPETTAEIPPEIPAEDSSSHPGASTPATDEFDNTEPGPAPFVQDSQSYPILTTNSEVPVDLAFPDPEEPYFILSLTEIPVFPTEEEMTPVSEAVSEAVSEPVSEPVPEPLPHLHAPDISSSQPHSSHVAVSGSDMAKESHAVLWNVPVPTTAQEGDVITTPSDEEVRSRVGADTQVESDHPSEEPVAKDNQELEKEEQEVDPPPKKRKLPAKSRKAAKPASTVRKQSDRTTSSAQTQKQTRSEPELSPSPCSAAPCPPAHTQASPTQHVTPGETSGPVRPSDLTNIEEDTPTGMGGEIEDKAEAVRGVTPLATTSPLSRPGRRPRGFLSYMADKGSPAPTGGPRGPIAASKRPQLNTSRPGRKRGDPVLTSSTNSPRPPAEVEASDTPDTNAPCILPVPGISNPPGLSTVQSTAADEEREGMAPAEEESINVSQFFFSDIFTEVEENEG